MIWSVIEMVKIKQLRISNFRSIEFASINIKPITVIYGPNSSGKSSILYAPLVLKNAILNPNQQISSFFNLLFSNLGGFEQVVFRHDPGFGISISIVFESRFGDINYGVSCRMDGTGAFYLEVDKLFSQKLNVTFPYPLNMSQSFEVELDQQRVEITWNGITLDSRTQPIPTAGMELIREVNGAIEAIKSIGVSPLRRGFTKPVYSQVPITAQLISEDEVVTYLMAPPGYLLHKVDRSVERIFGLSLRHYIPPGTTMIHLRAVDEKGRAAELVNEGFGINQAVYMLCKVLDDLSKVVMIEEPEIHLHPTSQKRLMEVLSEVAKEEKKSFILTTHSENIVTALLSLVAEHRLSNEDVACYLCVKDKNTGRTVITEQRVTSDGQIEGGLLSFMEEELQYLKRLLKITESI